MIYAVRLETGQTVLTEMSGVKSLDTENAKGVHIFRRVTPEYARRWVREGKLHETGLYIEDGKVRYAPEMEA